MKTLFLSVVLVCFSFVLSAQSNLVVSAYNYLKSGKLDKALESIEPTITNPKTMADAKAWLYRGNVYLSIAATKNEKYKNLCSNPLDVAYDSYQKSISLDKELITPASPARAIDGLYIVGTNYYDMGAKMYNSQNWSEAIVYFEKTMKINSSIGMKDSLATFYASQCATQLKDYETVIKYLKELVNMDYRNPIIYPMLIERYKANGDTTKIKGTLKIARQRFPDNVDILISEVNYYLGTGDVVKAQELLQKAIEKRPDDPVLHFTIGTNYDKLANDPSLDKETKVEVLKRSEESYRKAIELKPDYFDAYYNLGVFLFNAGVEKFDAANATPPDQEEAYNLLKSECLAYWEKATPVFEKANELDPTDYSTLIALKNLYTRLGKADKLKTVNDKINALPNKK